MAGKLRAPFRQLWVESCESSEVIRLSGLIYLQTRYRSPLSPTQLLAGRTPRTGFLADQDIARSRSGCLPDIPTGLSRPPEAPLEEDKRCPAALRRGGLFHGVHSAS